MTKSAEKHKFQNGNTVTTSTDKAVAVDVHVDNGAQQETVTYDDTKRLEQEREDMV